MSDKFRNGIKCCKIYGNFAEIGIKRYFFFEIRKRPKNGQFILFLAKCFKKGQIRLIWPF